MSRDPNLTPKAPYVDRTVDVRQMCKHARVLQGAFPIAWCPRFQDALTEEQVQQNLVVELRFSLDEHHLPRIEGRVSGSLKMICQRCLEPFDHGFELNVSLVYFESEEAFQKASERDRLPDSEAAEVIIVPPEEHAHGPAGGHAGHNGHDGHKENMENRSRAVSLAQLLEDDLLLGLPQVPKHAASNDGEEGGCPKNFSIHDAVVHEPKEERRNEQLAEGLAAIRDKLHLDGQ